MSNPPTPSPTPLEIAEQGVDESVSRFIGRLHEQIRRTEEERDTWRQRAEEAEECIVAAEAQVARIGDLLPTSFYAHLPGPDRVCRMVDIWRRSVTATNELEAQVAHYREALTAIAEHTTDEDTHHLAFGALSLPPVADERTE